MSYLVYIVLFLFLSLHECNARHLSNTHKVDLTALKHQASEPENLGALQEHIAEPAQAKIQENLAHANSIKDKDSEEEDQKGREIAISFSQEASEIEGWRRQARSTLKQDAEKAVNSKENDSIAEDVAVMDYAQPQHKPPIHN